MAGLLGWEAWFTAGVILALVVALVREVWRPDLVLLGSLGLLLVAGVVPPEVAFSGFSNAAVLTIAALFVVAAGVQKTEALAFLDRLLFAREHKTTGGALLRFMAPTALLSAFVNNTPLVAILIPRLQHWASRAGLPASKVMIPLSYAAVLGGMITLIGTSTNLVVSGLMQQTTGRGFAMFDLAWVGLPAAAAGIAFIALVGHRLLPERRGASAPLFQQNGSGRYHFELRVGAGAPLAGKTVEEAGLRALGAAYLTHIERGRHLVGPVDPHEVLQDGDVLAFAGDAAVIDELLTRPGLERVVQGVHENGRHGLPLFEAVVSGSSTLVGKTLKAAEFRDRFQGVVLAIQRRDEHLAGPLGAVPLRAGDLLLIEARPGFHERFNASREDFYLVAPYRPALPAPRRQKAPLALAIFAGMVGVSAAGLLPLVTAAFAAALLMLATGCLHLDETRHSIDVPVLLMIAAAFGIGGAIERTGLAATVAQGLVDATQALGPLAVLVAVYLVANVMTELLTNSAAAALVVPVALAAAARLEVDPLPFALAVAVAASAGFATPFGYQTNLMVMGAGGYRFTDYVRAGLPLNLIVMVVAVLMIWLVWM